MSQKLKCVLLVDDDSSCNFLHKRLLKKSNRVEQIEVAKDGLEALNFLKSEQQSLDKCPHCPDMIFLDINMPRMNGWQFLDAYRQLSQEKKKNIVVIMLTSSLNPDDKARAEQYEEVAEINYKLLNKNRLEEIFDTYFPIAS